jgi:phenylpropionate dioxygenase-like ring-hydroxylating dioxygenase large terminal subunit
MIHLNALLSQHRPGYALDGEFTTDDELHALEVGRVWRRNWIFAGHSAELPSPGDTLVVDLGDDSVIVARTRAGVLRAMHNTYSRRQERNVIAFVDWYLAAMGVVVPR